jgi:hypothetical protein
MDYGHLFAVLPTIGFVVLVGGFALALVWFSRERVRIHNEAENLRKRLAELDAA